MNYREIAVGFPDVIASSHSIVGELAVGKLVILKFGAGKFTEGFPVTLQIGMENTRPFSEVTGELPPAPELPLVFERWQAIYRSLDLSSRPVGIPKSSTPLGSIEACSQAARQLRDRLDDWLQAESFRPIREKWLEKLQPAETIRVILQTSDLQLQQLPWHLWDLMERYPHAEFAFSTATYERVHDSARPTLSVRILALLGDSRGIDTKTDRAILERLPDATITFLVEPARKDLTDQIWERNWDILFFAGHSSSSGSRETGRIYINSTESLTIDELRYALKKAVARGLKLAIFNSCDGLGLAREFADLQIPQMIVMREPVPDRVAQEFLKYFLEAFARNEPLYLAVREARERLQGLEGQFPCATWLPVIYQNLAEPPMTWTGATATWIDQPVRPPAITRTRMASAMLTSLAIALVMMGIRYLGLLQPLELQAFDQFLQLRPDEKPDTRLLVVTITEEDVQDQSQESRRGSLSEQSLAKLLEKLASYQPQVIGLDIYRDYPVAKDMPMLAAKMRQNDRLVTICKVSDPQAGRAGVAPPPEISSDRLGFSDLVLDTDSVVRRQLLALTPPPSSVCTAAYAFSMQLALRYLSAQTAAQSSAQNTTQNMLLQFAPDGAWQLGKVHFQPIEAHTGGYQGIDAWGHQILLNYRTYRSPQDAVPQVTLKQILSGQVDANVIKDRVVLIGTTAESFQDYSLTPYRTNQGAIQKIPGVILQAQMTSQLISAALGERSLLWTWTLWQETIWVITWSVAGGLLTQFARQWPAWGIAVGGAIVILYGICLVVLIQWSGWIPLVPAVLALLSSSGTVYIRALVQSRSLERSLRSGL